jgi:hypothetical protein
VRKLCALSFLLCSSFFPAAACLNDAALPLRLPMAAAGEAQRISLSLFLSFFFFFFLLFFMRAFFFWKVFFFEEPGGPKEKRGKEEMTTRDVLFRKPVFFRRAKKKVPSPSQKTQTQRQIG